MSLLNLVSDKNLEFLYHCVSCKQEALFLILSGFKVQIPFRILLINIILSKEYLDAIVECLCLPKICMLHPNAQDDGIRR